MISFDTFTGEAHGAIDEQRNGTLDEPHGRRRPHRRSARGRRSRRSEPTSSSSTDDNDVAVANTTDDELERKPSGDGRVYHLFQLLSLKNHTGDAKRALVQRLLGVNNVNELVLSKATEDQIASAANDAITDEILASVDQEDRRRQSESDASVIAETQIVVASQDHSTYRVLELVDVLDATTGGMVKRILTNVRRRQRGGAGWRKTEFCGFCVDYRTHNTAQHKCRVCGALGAHRSQFCDQTKASSSKPPTPRTPSGRRRSNGGAMTPKAAPVDELLAKDTASRLTPDATDKSYCTFCSTWGFHSTENHRCRICGITGEHRSRDCAKKRSGEGYRWRGSPAEAPKADRKQCDWCGALRNHSTEEHRCRICLKLGEHRSKNCPMHTPPSSNASDASPAPRPPSRGRLTPRTSMGLKTFCSFCGKDVAHRSHEHICRICRLTGLHRSGDCPARASSSASSSVLSYSVETASKVRDRVLESIPLVLPASATTLVMDSIDKVGDVDTILRRTLQRIGVWGGGSQTPITTPYAASKAIVPDIKPLPALQRVDGHGVYVLSYAEGRSVVPERILKYMRLLMHHEISTNAFSVVVVFDPRPSTWELHKPGMVTPRSLPSSPTMSEQLKKRMAKYTLQTLLGARETLVKLVMAQKRMQLELQQQQQQTNNIRSVMPPPQAAK